MDCRMRVTVWLALALAVLSAATGCGGGGDSTKSGGGSTKSVAAKRPITPRQRAESINLKLSDFPDGWRASRRPSASAQDAAIERNFKKCLGIAFSNATLLANAKSKDFKRGTASASSEARIAKTAAQAKAGLQRYARVMASPAIKPCFQAALSKVTGYKFGDVDLRDSKFFRRPPASDVDEARIWETMIPVETTTGPSKGALVLVFVDATLLRKGNILVKIETADADSGFAPALRDRLVRTVARRMSASA
jgi:hypothetical protein